VLHNAAPIKEWLEIMQKSLKINKASKLITSPSEKSSKAKEKLPTIQKSCAEAWLPDDNDKPRINNSLS